MSSVAPYAEYFPADDRLHVLLVDTPVARTKELDIWRSVDFSAVNRPVALEFTNVSKAGIILDNIPQRSLVTRLIQPLVAKYGLPLKRSTSRETAEREVQRLRVAIQDALTALGDLPCQLVIDACAGCAADIDEAREVLRTTLDVQQPVFEQPSPPPIDVTNRLQAIRTRREHRRRTAAAGS